MQRICTIVSYDIADDKRRTKVYDICRGYGQHVQYSVFRCDLTAMARAQLVADLGEVIHHGEDQVLFVTVGPTEGRAREAFQALGKRYEAPVYDAAIV